MILLAFKQDGLGLLHYCEHTKHERTIEQEKGNRQRTSLQVFSHGCVQTRANHVVSTEH